MEMRGVASSRESLSKALAGLVARKDAKIFQNLDVFEKAICEIGNCEATPEVVALKAGLQHRTPWELQKAAAGIVSSRVILNLTENIHKQNGIDPDLALWAIESWATALNIQFEPQPHVETRQPSPPAMPSAPAAAPAPTTAPKAVAADASPAFATGNTRMGIIYGVTESQMIKVFKSWWKSPPDSELSGMACTPVKIEKAKAIPLFSAATKPVKKEKKAPITGKTSFNITSPVQMQKETQPPSAQPAPAAKPHSPQPPRPAPAAAHPRKAPPAPAAPPRVYTGSAEDLYAQARSLMPGHGTRVDMAEALGMFNQAARMGHVPSICKIGEIYLKGLGVKTDVVQAANWFRKAADAGDAQAQFHLGTLYQCGMGVEFNLGLAQEWLSKAANNGHPEAREILNQLLQP